MNNDLKNLAIGIPVTGGIVGVFVIGTLYPNVGRFIIGTFIALAGLFLFTVLSYSVGNAIRMFFSERKDSHGAPDGL
jgi:hypothetical protein